MSILKKIDKERNVTVFTLVGRVDINSVRKVLEDMMESIPLKQHLLLDIRPAIFSRPLENEEIYALVEDLERYPGRPQTRGSGKSAVITDTDICFGIMRMFSSFAQYKKIPLALIPFRTMADAIKYFEDDTPQIQTQ